MKKIILTSITLFLLASNSSQAATTPTPKTTTLTPTVAAKNEIPTDTTLEKIQQLKSIVASKVAEMNLVEKRGLIGKITETSNTQLTIVDVKGQTRIVDIDELTKFAQDSKSAKDSSL